MSIRVSQSYGNVVNLNPQFRKSRRPIEEDKIGDDNPISRKGEVLNLIKTTFVGGLVLGGYLLAELVENGEFVLDSLFEYSKKLSSATSKKEKERIKTELENKKKSIKNNKILASLGIFASLIAIGVSGFALLYTAFNAPKIAYDSKVNAFKKSKEMDVYIKSNEAERELYEQLDNKARNSNAEEKDKLKVQYMQMKNAKNQVPDFVKI